MSSRIENIIEQFEKGEPVDLERASLLMGLDAARSDEQFIREHLERQREADDNSRHIGTA